MQKISARISLTPLPVLVPKSNLGPERGALAVGPVRGALAVGPPADAVGDARALLDVSVGRVVRLAASSGRGRGLGLQPGRGGRSSLRVGPVQGSPHVRGRGVCVTRAFSTARVQLRSHVDVSLKVSTSLKMSSLKMSSLRGQVPPGGFLQPGVTKEFSEELGDCFYGSRGLGGKLAVCYAVCDYFYRTERFFEEFRIFQKVKDFKSSMGSA